MKTNQQNNDLKYQSNCRMSECLLVIKCLTKNVVYQVKVKGDNGQEMIYVRSSDPGKNVQSSQIIFQQCK